MTLTNLNQFRASLNEGFDRGKDRIGAEIPLFTRFFVDDLNNSVVNFSPLFPALNGVIKVLHAVLNITIEHVIDVDFGLASLNDLVGNFAEQA